jgi:hypothetical protein
MLLRLLCPGLLQQECTTDRRLPSCPDSTEQAVVLSNLPALTDAAAMRVEVLRRPVLHPHLFVRYGGAV